MKRKLQKLFSIPIVVFNVFVILSVFLSSILFLMAGIETIGSTSIMDIVFAILYASFWLVINMVFWPIFLDLYVKFLDLTGLSKPVFDENGESL